MPEQKVNVRIKVNGKEYERHVVPRMLLVEFLREELDLTGTHIGCDTSFCGACTVMVNGATVKSCTMFAVMADGAEVLTVEGLKANGDFHPIQTAFAENHGLQCGYCTPGMMLSTLHLLEHNSQPGEREMRKAIAGNCCRCTGYQNIFKSIEAAAEKMRAKGAAHGD